MAPFKLKFRMGSSRSTSQEHDIVVDTQTQKQIFLNNYGSNTTIDSDPNTDSLISLNNDQRALLHNSNDTTDGQIGYTNPSLTHTETNNTIPLSPPPSYEQVIEENRLAAALDKDNNPTYINPQNLGINIEMIGESHQLTNMKQESMDSTLYTCSTATSPSQENLLECTGSCDPLYNMNNENDAQLENNYDCQLESDSNHQMNVGGDQCMSGDESEQNSDGECSYDNQYGNDQYGNEQYGNEQYGNEQYGSDQYGNDQYGNNQYGSGEYGTDQYSNEYDDQFTEQFTAHYESQSCGDSKSEKKGPEILYKSSKELYKAVAKECGITCKMSDQCRCLDCQSRYFDCEYDQNENEKTDGGLGAGTPMFISEVMHGTACTIL